MQGVFGRRLVITGRQEHHIADLSRIERGGGQCLVTGGRMPGLLYFQDPIGQLRDGLGKNRVHVVPQTPLFQCPIHSTPPAGNPIAETIQVSVEIVVLHHKYLSVGMVGVEIGQVPDDLQAQGGFPDPFSPKTTAVAGSFGSPYILSQEG